MKILHAISTSKVLGVLLLITLLSPASFGHGSRKAKKFKEYCGKLWTIRGVQDRAYLVDIGKNLGTVLDKTDINGADTTIQLSIFNRYDHYNYKEIKFKLIPARSPQSVEFNQEKFFVTVVGAFSKDQQYHQGDSCEVHITEMGTGCAN